MVIYTNIWFLRFGAAGDFLLTPGCYGQGMFGPRLSRVFVSRGHALWWSVMVLVTAYCVAADPPAEVAPMQDAGVTETGQKPADPWAEMKDVAKQREELLR